MKEEKYVTKFMSTFGALDEVPTHKTRRTTAGGVVMEFCYPGGDGVLLSGTS